MREVVIVDSVRTGLAKSFRGKFNMTRPDDMAAHCVDALLSRNDLDPALVEKIKAAFLALDPANPEHKAILDLQAASRFIETKPENYEGIEEAARAAGLLK